MKEHTLNIELQSDAIFGRGDGIAGYIDTEVEYDLYGCPYIRGRTIKGLLKEECVNILFSLSKFLPAESLKIWQETAQTLFGSPGSTEETKAKLHIGNAQLPADLRAVIANEIDKKSIKLIDILDSLTTTRQQTAMDPTGVPDTGSLRISRVVLRGTPFKAKVIFYEDPDANMLGLLAASTYALRRMGTERNRGKGQVVAYLDTPQKTGTYFKHFKKEVENDSSNL